MSGKVVIFSAPSGSGKTTIVKYLLTKFPNFGFSISACTRDKRGRIEEHGKDYYFLTPEDFKQKIDNNEFVEWEEVYPGAFYGTLKSEIERLWSENKVVLFDVDVKGGINLKNYFGENALGIFVKPPSLEILKERLSNRGTENEDSLSRRLFKAKFELTFEDRFDYVLVNDDINKSFKEAEETISKFLQT